MATSFETVFRNALESQLAPYGAIVTTDQTPLKGMGTLDAIIMNIASVPFKAVVVFAFPAQKDSRSAFLARGNDMDADVFDIYCDIANMVCGHVNRCLSKSFRFTGISTPIVLPSDTMTHRLFDMPRTEAIALEALSEQGIHLKLWVFVACGEKPLRFDARSSEPTATDLANGAAESGELELF